MGFFDSDDVDEVERLIVEAVENSRRDNRNQEIMRDFTTDKVEEMMEALISKFQKDNGKEQRKRYITYTDYGNGPWIKNYQSIFC